MSKDYIIFSQENIVLRSILEAKYDAFLHWKGINHEHEVPLANGSCIADFVLDNGTVVEVVGMLDFKKYAKRHQQKVKKYQDFGEVVCWIEPEEIKALYDNCPLKLNINHGRKCRLCNIKTHDIVKLHCRKCYMKYWSTKTKADIIKCAFCLKEFKPDARIKDPKFCSRKCYAGSITSDWPPWEWIDNKLQTMSIRQLAFAIDKKPTTMYARLRRRATDSNPKYNI